MKFRFFLIGLGVVLGATANAQIVNGNFSNTTGWSVLDCDFGGYVAGSHTADGSGSVYLNSNGTADKFPRVEQLLTGLVASTTYNVDFWVLGGLQFSNGDVLRAQVDGTTLFSAPNQQLDRQAWTNFNFDFVASGSTALLSVQAEVTGDSDYTVDDFKVTAVPEPCTMLVLAGLGALGFRRRK